MRSLMGDTTGKGRGLHRASLGTLGILIAIAAAVCFGTLPALADAPTPSVGADVAGGRVMLADWTAGSTVHVTVDNDTNPGNGTLAAGDVVMDQGNWKDVDNLGGTSLQSVLQPGRYVTASQGATTKTLQIAPLTTGGVDLASDTVTGTADPGVDLHVSVYNDSNLDWSVNTSADPSGAWVATFTAVHAIARGDNGNAMITDPDGDWTEAGWNVPNPIISVVVASDQLGLEEWPAGSTVHVVLDNDDNPGNGTLFSTDVNIDSGGGGWIDQDFIIGHGGLHVGQYVTATQGSITKVLHIGSLRVTAADTAADTVRGTAPAGAQIEVWDDNKNGARGTANASGIWSIHIPDCNIVPGDHGMASVVESDGDATRVDWTATGLTLKAAASKVRRRRPIVLSIAGKPTDIRGEWVTVSVKKPGKSKWSTVTRLVIPRVGTWRCTYPTTSKSPLGAYTFRVVYAGGWADLQGSSATVKVTLKR